MKFNTKMTKKLISTMAFSMLSIISFGQEGQNLVPNPSFEAVGKKPKKLGSIENSTGWVSPTGVRADLFVSTKVEDIAVPTNIYGTEHAKEGNNYAGIYAYSYGNKKPRSYVMTKLTSPLKKGMKYCVKFNISLAEASKYATNNIGVALDKKPFGTDSKVSLITEPSLLHFNNDQKVFSARYNWTEICGTFESKGNEKYITIGNFLSDADTKYERMKKDPKVKVSQVIAAYYYIDAVSVVLLGDGEFCDCIADEGNDQFSTTIYQKAFSITEEMTPTEKIEIQQAFFAFGKHKLSTEGEVSLDLIATEMTANPDLKLQINGHNNKMEDSVAAENDYYADMDNKRIGVVMEYLKAKGIAEGRFIASQKGSDSPNKDTNDQDDEDLIMAKNRRVTFKVR
jgi:OmpA-OmpF porin, OOP family